MKKIYLSFLILTTVLGNQLTLMAQVSEPDFIGESFVMKTDGTYSQLDKAIGDFTSGMSFSSNSFNALSLEIAGGRAQARFPVSQTLSLIVKAVDNNSDPLSIVSIYKFKESKNKRSVLISKDNSGTLMKSRTNSKDIINFMGKKYGTSSYLITLNNLKSGEYGIVVENPNSNDEKKVIVSCFAID
jgi:ribosomal protein S6E (S10)